MTSTLGPAGRGASGRSSVSPAEIRSIKVVLLPIVGVVLVAGIAS